MTLEEVIKHAEGIRSSVSNRLVRQSQRDLYAALAKALALCEQCEAEGLTHAFKAEVIARGREGGRRSYFEGEADIYLVVGRFCFSTEKGDYGSRCNAWRYTAAMREAHKRQIRSDGLAGWLEDNGGVNALYFGRPVASRSMTRKALPLTRSIEVAKGKPFTLTLCSNQAGTFDVINLEQEK